MYVGPANNVNTGKRLRRNFDCIGSAYFGPYTEIHTAEPGHDRCIAVGTIILSTRVVVPNQPIKLYNKQRVCLVDLIHQVREGAGTVGWNKLFAIA